MLAQFQPSLLALAQHELPWRFSPEVAIKKMLFGFSPK
jgi:hypothetical protein